jgi:hypothetical protein
MAEGTTIETAPGIWLARRAEERLGQANVGVNLTWRVPENKMNAKTPCTIRYMESPMSEIRVEKNARFEALRLRRR